MITQTILDAFKSNSYMMARMISYSKSEYRHQNPNNEVYFNANIFVLGEGKVWYGDIDVTKDTPTLQKIATQAGVDLYILSEMDGRFENEQRTDDAIIAKAKIKITK